MLAQGVNKLSPPTSTEKVIMQSRFLSPVLWPRSSFSLPAGLHVPVSGDHWGPFMPFVQDTATEPWYPGRQPAVQSLPMGTSMQALPQLAAEPGSKGRSALRQPLLHGTASRQTIIMRGRPRQEESRSHARMCYIRVTPLFVLHHSSICRP
jgi:hypothetical protein